MDLYALGVLCMLFNVHSNLKNIEIVKVFVAIADILGYNNNSSYTIPRTMQVTMIR